MHAQGGLCSGEYQPFIVDRTVFGAVPPIRKLFVPEDISGRFDNRSWALKAKVHSWTLSIMRQSTVPSYQLEPSFQSRDDKAVLFKIRHGSWGFENLLKLLKLRAMNAIHIVWFVALP